MPVDQEVVTKLAELDMMVADLEHANSRVATVERRNVCWQELHWITPKLTGSVGTSESRD